MMKRLIVFLLVFVITKTSAQENYFNQLIPIDSSIIIGKLDNGIKYYIKYNKRPEKRVELRLAVNAGSVLEDSDQIGLAHFVEHMAFNGTTNFPKNQLVSYLQSMGIKFGPEINAYTGFDQTVYMLMVPTDKNELIDKSIQILQDWAHNLTFDSIEIEKERGVVIEEWRLGRGADQRMEDKYIPILFYKSKYAERLPIGTLESLQTFSHSSLKRFYHDWYRPDLMAVVVVGDINPKEMEEKIKKYFSAIPKVENPRKRIVYDLPSHKETLFSIVSDKEASEITVNLFYKTPFVQEKTIGDYKNTILRILYNQMFNQRISEILRKPNPPFINANSFYGNIGARTKYAYGSTALVNNNDIEDGLARLLIENERVRKYGFTETELERAKLDVLKLYEKYYNDKDKTESDNFADEYVRNFLLDEPIPGIKKEYEIVVKSLPEITLKEVNNLANIWMTDSDRVVIVTAPENENIVLPSESRLRDIIDSVSKINIEPYEDNSIVTSLLNKKPKKGKIVKEKTYPNIETTELILSNGVKVFYKKTNFKNDEILLSAISRGGQSLYSNEDHFSAKFSTQIITESGIGNFSAIQLQKILAGKNVNVSPFIDMYSEGIKGSSTPKDLETFFQLIYLYFTQPALDTVAVKSWKERTKSYLSNIIADPMVYYSDQLARILSQNHPRGNRIPLPEDIDKIDPKKSFQIFKERFSNAADFEFSFVGNIPVDTFKNYVLTYLASLPGMKMRENYKDLNIRPPKNIDKKIFKGSDPKSHVTLIFNDTMTYNRSNAYYLRSLEDYLDIRLYEILREELSGVYGVGVTCSLNRIPYQNYNVIFRIPCAPNNVDSLVNQSLKIIEDIKMNGISDDYLKKIKETQLREHEINIKTNNYWLNYLENTSLFNDDISRIDKFTEEIEKLSSNDIKNIANRVFDHNKIQVTLFPEKK